jgi:hypothetical protein
MEFLVLRSTDHGLAALEVLGHLQVGVNERNDRSPVWRQHPGVGMPAKHRPAYASSLLRSRELAVAR